MPLIRKKTQTNAHRFWSLANLRRQRLKKSARGRIKRNSDFTNLQLGGVPVEGVAIANPDNVIVENNEGFEK